MNIVIAGDGKVGSSVAEELAKEGHSIVMIDNKPRVLEAEELFDVISIMGNGASYDVQMAAGVPHADLMIAATSSDETNILCCMVAKKLGAKHTIARVRNPEYSSQLRFFQKELGLSMVVNPEMAAAGEIYRILRFPSAIKLDSFARGSVELAEVKILEGSPLVGLPLWQLSEQFKVKVLVGAVQRDNQVIIPDGHFVLQEGDKIHIAGPHLALANFLKATGIFKEKVKNVLLIGGGKIAFYLARRLLESNMHVTVIEQDRKRCAELSEQLPKALVICGDGTDPALLQEEGIERTDACVSLTGVDEENILISMYAGTKQVPKVITKINRTSFREMLQSVGIESVISPKKITTDQIVRYVRAMHNSEGSSFLTLYRLVDNQVEAMEFRVETENAPYVDIPLKQLKLKRNILIACIIRENKVLFPGGDDAIRYRDTVILVTNERAIRNLDEIMQ